MKINRNILNTMHSIAMKLSNKNSYTECDITALISTDNSNIDLEICGYNDNDGNVKYIGCISDENIATQVSITDGTIEYNSTLSNTDPYTFESSLNINNSIILLEDLFHKNIYGILSATEDGILKSRYKIKNNKFIDILRINKENSSVEYENNRCHIIDIINTVIDHIESNYTVSKIEIRYSVDNMYSMVGIAYSPKGNKDIVLWSFIPLAIDYSNEYDNLPNIIVTENKLSVSSSSMNRTRTEFDFAFNTSDSVGLKSQGCMSVIIPSKIKNTETTFLAHFDLHGYCIEITSDEAVDTDMSNQFDCPIDLEDLCVLTVQIEK